jgi:F-type H+-transporting ATPase subunit delta
LSASAITKRYAKALVELGTERQQVESFGNELNSVGAVFASERVLSQLMESPTFALEKKNAILSDLSDLLKLSDDMRKFVGLLLIKDRIAYVQQIAADYQDLADELSGVQRAQIVAATVLDAAQQKAISDALAKQTGKKVEIKTECDPDLIGGLRVEIGGKVFDGSVKTQLKRIEDTLKKG